MFGDTNSLFDNIPTEHRPGPEPSPPGASGAVGAASPDGIGASPDGLGAHARPTGVGAYAVPMSGEVEWLEPHDTSPQAAVRTAGITALGAAIFFGGGLALGGPWGGVSGILLSGAGFNIYRAQKWWGSADPSEKHEAVVSALFGAVGIAAGGYTAYKAYDARK